MGYHYPHRDDDILKYGLGGAWILAIILLLSGVNTLQDLGVGLFLGGSFLVLGIGNYYQTEGADYIVTHYSGEDAIKEAMKLTKDARNESLGYWVFGGFLFMFFAWVGLGISMTLTGLANLTNFIIMIIAHRRYSELRKMLMVLQLKKSDKAEIAIKL